VIIPPVFAFGPPVATLNQAQAQAQAQVQVQVQVQVRVAEVFRDAVRQNAVAVVAVHNHPSGDPTPSSADVALTAELAKAGALLDIDLLDHLVIGQGRWVSLRAAKTDMFPPMISRLVEAIGEPGVTTGVHFTPKGSVCQS